ncbi:MAG: GGDEF domain-containing protein [Rhodospirillaceae bacterium]
MVNFSAVSGMSEMYSAADRMIDAVRREVNFSFQPIVSAISGKCFGFESIALGAERLGFPTLAALYDYADDQNALERLELTMRELALQNFARFCHKGEHLFLGFDRRSLTRPGSLPQQTTALLARHGINPTSVCLTLPETEISFGARASIVTTALEPYRRQSYLLALDQFGLGAASLRPIYDQQPNIIRVASVFTADIATDERKRLLLSTVVGLALVLGITVIADGIINEAGFRACKQIGCHLVQGDFVGPPTASHNGTGIARTYPAIIETNRLERRERHSDQKLLRDELNMLPAVNVHEPMTKIFQYFRSQKEYSFLPIVDDRQQPLGIIREIDLKDVIYSRYGKDLLHNKALNRGPLDFLRPCPVCDINTEAEKILEIFSQAANPPGVLLVDDFTYVGALSAASLVRVINEKNLVQARDQNPLTRLPGNISINNYITAAQENPGASLVLVYFDLDNFKPFNDRFGFRQGDRAILLFSDLMRTHLSTTDTFLGHIGGDDFFAAFHDMPPEQIRTMIETLLTTFRHDIESFYDPESRISGYIIGHSRDGEIVQIPLLSCSAAVVEIPAGAGTAIADDIARILAGLKKAAKKAPEHIAILRLGQQRLVCSEPLENTGETSFASNPIESENCHVNVTRMS